MKTIGILLLVAIVVFILFGWLFLELFNGVIMILRAL